MEAMIPLKLRWSALWTSFLCLDDEYMDVAKRSGLLHVNMGFESINADTLKGMNKRFNKVEQYHPDARRPAQARGISYSLNFIFGWDNETPAVFRSTLDFLEEEKVPVAYFNILCPEIGTMFYEKMKSEDRILRIEDIGRFSGRVSPSETQKFHRRIPGEKRAGLVRQVLQLGNQFSIGCPSRSRRRISLPGSSTFRSARWHSARWETTTTISMRIDRAFYNFGRCLRETGKAGAVIRLLSFLRLGAQ